jgi:hypothetical protein
MNEIYKESSALGVLGNDIYVSNDRKLLCKTLSGSLIGSIAVDSLEGILLGHGVLVWTRTAVDCFYLLDLFSLELFLVAEFDSVELAVVMHVI